MEIVNITLIIVGLIVTILGIAAFFIPNLTRLINFPGGPKLKAIGSIVIGIIIIIIGLIVKFPTK